MKARYGCDRPNEGGSAFPYVVLHANTKKEQEEGLHAFGSQTHHGMTLRDYFAAMALPALIPACNTDDREGLAYPEHVAACAYGIADAMLKARDAE